MNKENKLLIVLNYVGFIGAVLASIAYVVVVFVLIKGFKYQQTSQTIIFAIANAVVGFIIMSFLKLQGQLIAENIPENKLISEQYYKSKTKDKKPHTMKFFWITSTIKDIAIKALSVAGTTFGLIYIVIQGSNDFTLLWIAIVNLILFISFGFISMNKAYNFYNNNQIPYMVEQLKLEDNNNAKN